MLEFLKKKKEDRRQMAAVARPPFEQREVVHSLAMVVTIINRHQADYYLEAYKECGAALTMVLYAYSMPPEELRNILGINETKKDILLTICRQEFVPSLLQRAKERFSISKASKGICFSCPIDAVSGIAVYKFLSDQNKNVRIFENGSK